MEENPPNLGNQLENMLQHNINCIDIQLKNIKRTLEINQFLINTSTQKLQNIITRNLSETNSVKLREFEIAIGVLSQILQSIVDSTKALTSLKRNLDSLKSYLEQDYGDQFVSQYLNEPA